jgi:hypothetical protein
MTISKYGRIAVAASFAAVLAMPAIVIAQEAEEDTGPNFFSVRTVHVNTDGGAEWVALQEQLAAAQKEAGNGHRSVYQEVRGSLDTYHIVSAYADHSGFDGAGDGLGGLGEAQADWVGAIGKTISSRTQRESRIHKDLVIPRDQEAERNLLVVRQFKIKQGQGDAFHTWLADELRPVLVAGGAQGVRFSHMNQGGDVTICTIASEVANWAEFDADGAFSHLSEGERTGLFAKWGDMVEGHSMIIGQYRANMSY